MKTYTKALIIDDDSDLCAMLKAVIQNSIPDVQCASTLFTGRQLVEQLHPDLIFLDNNLPDGRGLEWVKEIRSLSPKAFIVFITALNTPKNKALEYGVDVFLEKPFTYTAIFQALESDTKEKNGAEVA